jgi:hypothetical protein
VNETEQTHVAVAQNALANIATRLENTAARIRRAGENLPRASSYVEEVAGVVDDVGWAGGQPQSGHRGPRGRRPEVGNHGCLHGPAGASRHPRDPR